MLVYSLTLTLTLTFPGRKITYGATSCPSWTENNIYVSNPIPNYLLPVNLTLNLTLTLICFKNH